ncbi:ABC transporter permease [Streptomyces radicis]|uniref:ABC transporter permease n=1 Tax=Streptomyces radicis TaxID=1750517 RepID=A0A3A9WFD0_9ACTN|nr:ABC transporter permease [Streptomyces radicis]RKN11489.1 ABC transporter permease [Streptomyces radicis]RKN26492.1 ABC transporter permease [Streptomyces radicis]
MLAFIVRRLFVSIWVFLAASVVIFFLAVNVRDPLSEARQLPGPAQESAMAEITERMHLDEPTIVRYFLWLADVLTGDLGVNRQGQDVNAMLEGAFTATLQLVTGATVLAIVVGITIGVVSALRQYTALDQTVTFVAFICFSLPVFWIGTLLKQFLALDFNDWLADPTISPVFIGGIALLTGMACASIILGDRRTRLISFAASAAAMATLLAVLSATEWFTDPGLGPFVVALSAAAGAIGFTTLVRGLEWQRPLQAALMTAGVGVVAMFALDPVLDDPDVLTIGGLAVLTAAVSAGIGWYWGGDLYRQAAIPSAVLTGLFTGAVIFTDRMLMNFDNYSASVGGRPISTVGAETPNYEGTFWESGLDSFGHLALPTLALVLLSLASYTRYTRASMLEVMNQDYVRTARAKGLSERAVVTRHVLRNGLIPITTLVAYDIGAILGGAVVTEQVFGWSAMGSLLFTGIEQGDPMPIMAFFLVTGGAVVVFNMLADIAYAFVDPRIRLS